MQIVIGIALLAAGAIIDRVATAVWSRTAERRRWQFEVPDQLRISISGSVVEDTGDQQFTTGLEQAKALAVVLPSLGRAWRSVDVRNVTVSGQVGGGYEGNLVLMGEPDSNQVTKDVLDEFGQRLGVSHDGTSIKLYDFEGLVRDVPRAFLAEVTEEEHDYEFVDNDFEKVVSWYWRLEAYGEPVQEDYGLVIRVLNPFGDSAVQHRIVIFCGSHRYGTLAAARWFVDADLPEGDFAAIVKTSVKEQHAHPPQLFWIREMPTQGSEDD